MSYDLLAVSTEWLCYANDNHIALGPQSHRSCHDTLLVTRSIAWFYLRICPVFEAWRTNERLMDPRVAFVHSPGAFLIVCLSRMYMVLSWSRLSYCTLQHTLMLGQTRGQIPHGPPLHSFIRHYGGNYQRAVMTTAYDGDPRPLQCSTCHLMSSSCFECALEDFRS